MLILGGQFFDNRTQNLGPQSEFPGHKVQGNNQNEESVEIMGSFEKKYGLRIHNHPVPSRGIGVLARALLALASTREQKGPDALS